MVFDSCRRKKKILTKTLMKITLDRKILENHCRFSPKILEKKIGIQCKVIFNQILLLKKLTTPSCFMQF